MKRNNISALKLLIVPLILGTIFFTTLSSNAPMYIIGQISGGLFLAQAFILMHEFGHNSFFTYTKLNSFFGYLISPLTFIPFYNWEKIHTLHHDWTGFRDKDPTTEGTFAEQLNPKRMKIVNFCWKYYIPIFSMGYRFGTYWKKEKLKRFLSSEDYSKALTNINLYTSIYIFILIFNFTFFISILPAIYISWMITDIIMLSQHAHIEMLNSEGQEVEPLKYAKQPAYSRSIQLPFIIGKYFFCNFNYHEAHHAYPGLPCYLLSGIKVTSTNSYPLIPWLKKVKSMDGVDYIFRSSKNRDHF